MKSKLKWCREHVDNYEDMFLIPVGVDGVDDNGLLEDGELAIDKAVAFIKIGYSQCRFYTGRGGEGTSRPDGYAAYVRDGSKERLVVDGSNTQLRLGGIFSDKYTRAFTSLRDAKNVIKVELDKGA